MFTQDHVAAAIAAAAAAAEVSMVWSSSWNVVILELYSVYIYNHIFKSIKLT